MILDSWIRKEIWAAGVRHAIWITKDLVASKYDLQIFTFDIWT